VLGGRKKYNSPSGEVPRHHLPSVDAEGILQILTGTGAVAIGGNREVNANLGHEGMLDSGKSWDSSEGRTLCLCAGSAPLHQPPELLLADDGDTIAGISEPTHLDEF